MSSKFIGFVVVAVIVGYLIVSGTAAAFWSGFWPALHNGPVFQNAKQKSAVIDFGIVLAVVFTVRWIVIRVLSALGVRVRSLRHPR